MAKYSMDWIGDLKFRSGDGQAPLELHSSTTGMLSPVMTLSYALMACMGMDVVHVITKGRHDLRALKTSIETERASEPPRRLTSVKLHFDITGDVPARVVERAIMLSREKYCSVSNSLRKDIDFRTSFAIHAG